MSEEKEAFKKMLLEEDAMFPDGVYAIPHSEHQKVKVRALYEYCQSKGISSPKDLTEEELKKFL